jgi:hypothetical protein
MDKMSYYYLIILISFPIVNLIIVLISIIGNSIQIIQSEFYSPLLAIFFFISASIIFLLFLKMVPRYRITKSNSVLHLLLFLLFASATNLIALLFSLIGFKPDLLNSYWNNLMEFLLYPYIFFFGYFIIEVFFVELSIRKKRNIIFFICIYLIILEIFSSITIFVENTLGDTFLIFFSLSLLLIANSLNLVLIYSSFKIYRHSSQNYMKNGFLLMGLSGIFLFIGFLFNFLSNINAYLDVNPYFFAYISFFSMVIGSILLYFGFTLPMSENKN